MYLAIESRSAWDHTFRFPPALLEGLKFWFNNIGSLVFTPFGLAVIRPLLFFLTRATQPSEGFCLPRWLCGQRSDDRRFGSKFYFSRGEPIYYVLLSFVEHLKPKKVKKFYPQYECRQEAARIVSFGSSKVHLQSVALSIFCFCFFSWYCPGSAVDSQVTRREGRSFKPNRLKRSASPKDAQSKDARMSGGL